MGGAVFFFKIFDFLGCQGVKCPKWQKNSVCFAPYLNDFHLWYTFVEWYLGHFLIFYKILIFGVVSGGKRAKIIQNHKYSVRRAPCLRNHSWYDCDLWYNGVTNNICKCFFFHFFKSLILQIVFGVKG